MRLNWTVFDANAEVAGLWLPLHSPACAKLDATRHLTGRLRYQRAGPIARQVSALWRQGSAQRFICPSRSECTSHSFAQASHISAHSAQICVWCGERRAMKSTLVMVICAQSISATR